MEIHRRCLGRIRKADGTYSERDAEDAIVQRIQARGQGGHGARSCAEDSEESAQHEGGEAQAVLQLLVLLLLECVCVVSSQTLQAYQLEARTVLEGFGIRAEQQFVTNTIWTCQ